MANDNNNEIWVFLSHSNKDYEKVRQVRNMLEEQSLRPLMFFLHCLNDDDEIDSLIKREIDCRTRFILCDSENARKSPWVQKEVEYIKSQNRICETIDLSKSIDEIMSTLQDFINKTRIFISYNREEYPLAEMVYHRLCQYDFAVYMDMLYNPNEVYTQDYSETIQEIKQNAEKGGYLVSIANERILSEYSASRFELIKAIKDNHDAGHAVPNIIPFVMQDSIVDRIKNDKGLQPLLNCGVQCLERFEKDRQCDEIVKRVVTQLMTPGSIKVLADNLAKGTSGMTNTKEANFLYRLLNIEDTTALTSESGTFYVDDKGVVQRFIPADDNPFVDEEIEVTSNYTYMTYKSIRTFIVPKGVKGFISSFMRHTRVLERFELPDGLLSLGNNSFDINTGCNCVFANCILPTVVIPESVKEIGIFAFGHSHIDCLQLPKTLHSPIGRQFCDSFIGTLRLPKEWEHGVSLVESVLRFSGRLLDNEKYGYLRWPGTIVGDLKFY